MSRYDYPDPGIDPAYCDGLAADDDDYCPECYCEPCMCKVLDPDEDPDDDDAGEDETDL